MRYNILTYHIGEGIRNLFKNNRNYIIMIRKDCAGADYKTLEEALVNLLEK